MTSLVKIPSRPSKPSVAPRRVAVFAGNYVDVVDGVSKTIRRLVAHLRRRGDQVMVFAPCGPDPALTKDPQQVVLPSVPLCGVGQPGYRYSFCLSGAAREALEAFGPDLVHLTGPGCASAGAITWARRRAIPVVGSFHTNFASYFRFLRGWRWFEPVAWKLVTRFYSALDRVFVPTPSMLEELRRKRMTASAEVWARGVELSEFSPERRDLAWRRGMGIQDDEVVVTFIARLNWEKGLKRLARVLEALEARGVRHRVMIVGEGPGESYLRDRLPRAIFTGFLSGDALRRAYASGDVFVYPSETDTFGNVTLEAMASGLPVVAVDAPGTRCVAGDSAGVVLCDRDDITGLTHALAEFVEDSNRRREAGDRARERAARFTWSAVLDGLCSSYEDVLRLHARVLDREIPSLQTPA